MHRFYIDTANINGDKAVITGQDAKHLVNVLRLGKGVKVELADGKGFHYLSEIESAASKEVLFKIIDKKYLQGESNVHTAVAQGMLKDKKMDTVLRHLTELGINEWIPFFAKRSVPEPAENKNRLKESRLKISDPQKIKMPEIQKVKISDPKVERWERIVKESIKQCGRSMLPIIHQPMSFDDMLNLSDNYDKKITFWEESETKIEKNSDKETSNTNGKNIKNPRCCKIIVMIGPEGGFSEDEIDTAEQKGFEIFSLGKRILRAETAAVAASVLIQHIFGDI